MRADSNPKPSSKIIDYTFFPSPIGRIGIAATSKGICRICLNEGDEPAFQKKIRTEYRRPVNRRDERFTDLVAALRSYLSGEPTKFRLHFDLREGTTFQRKVWQALRRIPYGQTRSYHSIARSIGRPKSSRAVGGACGSNPIPLLIPCHRVIGSNGRLGGFSGGIHIKRRLLSLEGIKRF